MTTFKSLATKRESCRNYQNKPVAHADLTDIVETAILAPSASNRQSWHFDICEGETAKEIGKLCMALPNNNTWAAQCPAFIVISSTTRKSEILGMAHEFPVVDAGLAAAYLCLAAAEKDLATCIVGSADEEGVKKLLGIDPERRMHILVAVGYGAEPFKMTKDRKPFDELVSQHA